MVHFVAVTESRPMNVGRGLELVAEADCPKCEMTAYVARTVKGECFLHSGCMHASHVVTWSENDGTEVCFQ